MEQQILKSDIMTSIIESKCPYCSGWLESRKGKYGMFYKCSICRQNVSEKYLERMSDVHFKIRPIS